MNEKLPLKLLLIIQVFFRELLGVRVIRAAVAAARWFLFVKLMRHLRVLDSVGAAGETVRHNLGGVRDFAQHRSLCLIRPLTSVISICRAGKAIERYDFPDERVLSIGPRSEGELLNLVAHGFRPGNIRGLDLISYSPWVDLGDMHAMPYVDNSWDAIICGWVLAYSDQKQVAVNEIVRVAKPGALVAVGVEYCGLNNEQLVARYGYLAGSTERIWSVRQVETLFEGHIDQIYFKHDVVEARKQEEVVALLLVFSIKK